MVACAKTTINPDPSTMPDIDAMPDCALLRLPPCCALAGCARSTWFYWVKIGHAPKPVRIGLKAVAWRVGDIKAFLRGRDCGPAPSHTVAGGKAGRAKQLAAKAAELI
jgi:prophage regulatory protein